MELRYWPMMPGETEECSRELLWLITCAKQRVIIGLYMLVSQVQMKIAPSPSIPSLLMDYVVLPAVPVLKFLCSGEALLALIDLKQMAFAQTYTVEQAITLPESAYFIHNDLQTFYANHHW